MAWAAAREAEVEAALADMSRRRSSPIIVRDCCWLAVTAYVTHSSSVTSSMKYTALHKLRDHPKAGRWVRRWLEARKSAQVMGEEWAFPRLARATAVWWSDGPIHRVSMQVRLRRMGIRLSALRRRDANRHQRFYSSRP